MNNYNRVYKETKKLTILYIEDDTSFLKETTRVFKELFYRVDTAIDGKEGLDKYKLYQDEEKSFYDIVITDISMPSMSGVELTREIYKVNKNQSIIVISAHNESKYLFELINMGIEQFLIKPIDFDILINVLFEITSKIEKNDEIQEQIKIIELKEDFSWDTENSLLLKKGQIIKLTKKEIFLMQILIKNGSKVSTFQEILNCIYDDLQMPSDEILKPLVSRLRKKIPKLSIENVYGLGYRLIF